MLMKVMGRGSLYRGRDILGKACMCDTCHSRIIFFALGSKQEREENFGHNKKRAKKRGKRSFFSEKMKEKKGFYDRVWT